MKKLAFPLAFAALLSCPAIASNPVYNRLTVVAFILVALEPYLKLEFALPGKLFLVWLAWAFFCCVKSDYPAVAIQGYHLRVEGFLTYAVITVLAASYWSGYKSFRLLAILTGIYSIIISIFYYQKIDRFDPNIFRYVMMPEVAWGALTGLTAITLFNVSPYLLGLVVPSFYFCENRSGIIGAIVGIAISLALQWDVLKRKGLYTALICSFLVLIILSPTGVKFRHLDSKFVGAGSRPQWILQSNHLMKALPLTGFGLDTLSFYLEPSRGESTDVGKIADKTHNLMYDIILETGWIGYTLFLFVFGSCCYYAFYNRTHRNIACFSIICGWISISFLNPSGIYAETVALVALFGMEGVE